MNGPNDLPIGFECLDPFVAYWAADTLGERDQRRLYSSSAQREAFYTSAKPIAAKAMDYLDTKSVQKLVPSDQNLMNLMLSLIHVTLAVELQKEDEHIHAEGAKLMPIIKGHSEDFD